MTQSAKRRAQSANCHCHDSLDFYAMRYALCAMLSALCDLTWPCGPGLRALNVMTEPVSQMSPAWYAIYAQVRHESKVYARLLAKSFECLLPQIERWSRRRDRRKKIHVPIFPGYLFVHTVLDNYQQVKILQTAGVVRIVRTKDGPLPVPDSQMNSLITLLGNASVLTTHPYLNEGMRVKIVNGPLYGCEGILVRKKNEKARLVVAIDIIQQAVSVELSEEDVEPISL
jgi:transcriptional antiterminator NusG